MTTSEGSTAGMWGGVTSDDTSGAPLLSPQVTGQQCGGLAFGPVAGSFSRPGFVPLRPHLPHLGWV